MEYFEPAECGECYICKMVAVFREVRRVLRKDGTLWLNMGDSYAGSGGAGGDYGPGGLKEGQPKFPGKGSKGIRGGSPKHAGGVLEDQPNRYPQVNLKAKDLCGIPWRLALSLQADGWWLRSDIIWHKPNPMPESVTDRPTTAHEHIFLLTKSARYFYDAEAVKCNREGNTHSRGNKKTPPIESAGVGHKDWCAYMNKDEELTFRNLRSVWTLATEPFNGWAETSRQVLVERDAVSDGMMHKVSPSCPVHGSLYHQNSSHSDDAHEVDGQTRNEHNDGHPAQERLFDSDSIEMIHGEDSWEHNWDSPPPMYFPSATGHSKQNRKKGLAPVTTSPCISSGEIPSRTGDKQEKPGNTGSGGHIAESNILGDCAEGEKGSGPAVQTLCRTVDKSFLPIPPECLCEFYQEVTQKSSHFATFPTSIPERCIKAGTSEKGVCPKCGAPWVRMVEKVKRQEPTEAMKIAGCNADGEYHGQDQKDYQHSLAQSPSDTKRRILESMAMELTTTGWQPTCKCPESDPIPATVLDVFSGAATTLMVAAKLGRDAIGIELNRDYVAMSVKRLKKELGMLVEIDAR